MTHHDELRLIESPAERRRARREINRRLWKHHRGAAILICAVPGGLAGGLACTGFARWLAGLLQHAGASASLARPLAVGLLGGVLGALGGVGVQWFLRRPMRLARRQYLLELGIPICLHCGYDLRGQTEPRCPECGREFDPAILNKPDSGGAARNA